MDVVVVVVVGHCFCVAYNCASRRACSFVLSFSVVDGLETCGTCTFVRLVQVGGFGFWLVGGFFNQLVGVSFSPAFRGWTR